MPLRLVSTTNSSQHAAKRRQEILRGYAELRSEATYGQVGTMFAPGKWVFLSLSLHRCRPMNTTTLTKRTSSTNSLSFADVPSDRKHVKTSVPEHYREQPADAPLASALGVFSLALGLWEVLDPHGVARRTGTSHPALIRAYGLREIATGIGIFVSPRPAGALWARVAGDVVDLATLASAFANAPDDPVRRRKTVMAAAAVAGVTVLDLIAARQHTVGYSTC